MSTRSLSVAHLNVRSLLAHFDNVRELLIGSDYDVFAVTETWLCEDVPEEAVRVGGYTFLRRDRRGRGGGVGIYVKTSLTCAFLASNDSIEQVWVKSVLNTKEYAFGVVY